MRAGSLEVLLPPLRRRIGPLSIAVLAGTLAQGIGVAMPLLVRRFVHGMEPIQADGPATRWTSVLALPAGILLALVVLQGSLRWWRAMLGERVAQHVLADVRAEMYAHLQRLAQGYYDRRPVGNIVVRFVGDATALRTWVARTIVGVPADVITVCAVAVAVGSIEPRLLAVAAIPLALLVPVQAWLAPRARALTHEGRRWQTLLCGFLGERLPAMAAIQATNAQEADRAEATGMITAIQTANVARGKLDAWSQAFSVAATTAALGAVGLWGAWLHWNGALTQTDLLAAVWLLLLIRSPIQRLAQANVNHQRVRVATERIVALLERRAQSGSSRRLESYPGPGRTLVLRRISYRDRSGRWLLRDVTAHLEGPGLVVVRGGSERARTALLELVLRLRRPHAGRIRLDGRDVRVLRVDDVRARMGWVDRERRVAEIAAACTPGGLKANPGFATAWSATEILAPGVALPGERETAVAELRRAPQEARLRVAALSALLRDPPILLVDEPTLMLGERSAAQARTWLEEMARTRLVVVASGDPAVDLIAGQTLDLGASTPDALDIEQQEEPSWNGSES